MDFFAIDIETANPDMTSICQIAIIGFQNGKIELSWQKLVNPKDYFDGRNISIHGITEEMVTNSPTISLIWKEIKCHLESQILASHTPFDRVALSRCASKFKLPPIECKWIDTARVVRRTWENFRKDGYGLSGVAKYLGINFNHHIAIEDARVAGEILIHASEKTKISVSDWLNLSTKPMSGKISREGNPDGPLFGETIVFTGSLSIPRREAADLASKIGCRISDSVNRTTTLLIVGDQDFRKLSGNEKSSKHRKAEELIMKGQMIRILGETDFKSLIQIEG